MDPSLWVLHCADLAYDILLLKQSSGAATACSLHHATACAETCLECTVSESKGVKYQSLFIIFN